MNIELKKLTEQCNKEISEIKEKYKLMKEHVREKYKNQKKTKKQHIPKKLKNMIWDKYIGKEKGIGLCYSCNEEIDSKNFEAGHIIPEAKGGPTNVDNLRPICSCCNKSMGTQNMDVFKKTYMKPKTFMYNGNRTYNKKHIYNRNAYIDDLILINRVLKPRSTQLEY